MPLLLLCDFDGTLCEFRADPASVWLSTARRDLLQRICGLSRTTVGIVSGRRLDDVRLRTGLSSRRIFVAGLHGLEIDGGNERFVHADVASARDRAQHIATELRPLITGTPGVFTEDKELSVALHFREAAPNDRRRMADVFSQVVSPALARGEVRVMRGACVLEVLPNIPWTKGDAVKWIRDVVERKAGPHYTVYIGDDTTDEDAFRAIEANGLSIAASDRVSGADFLVDGPAQVERILAGLGA